MKFNELYKKVFIAEQDQVGDPESEVAVPEDVNVEPAPIISAEQEPGAEEALPVDQTEGEGSTNLSTYVDELDKFANKLNSIEGDSLQKLLASLDRAGTPFEGISERTKGEIVSAAKSLQAVSERIKEFIIHAAKAK